jgi:hypothetical protein
MSKEMDRLGLPKEAQTYGSLLYACSRVKDFDRAYGRQSLFSYRHRTTRHPTNDTTHATRHDTTNDTINDTHRLSVVADMVKAGHSPNEHIFTELVNSCASKRASHHVVRVSCVCVRSRACFFSDACVRCVLLGFSPLAGRAEDLEQVAGVLDYVEKQQAPEKRLNMLSPYNCFMGKCLEMGATGTHPLPSPRHLASHHSAHCVACVVSCRVVCVVLCAH